MQKIILLVIRCKKSDFQISSKNDFTFKFLSNFLQISIKILSSLLKFPTTLNNVYFSVIFQLKIFKWAIPNMVKNIPILKRVLSYNYISTLLFLSTPYIFIYPIKLNYFFILQNWMRMKQIKWMNKKQTWQLEIKKLDNFLKSII